MPRCVLIPRLMPVGREILASGTFQGELIETISHVKTGRINNYVNGGVLDAV